MDQKCNKRKGHEKVQLIQDQFSNLHRIARTLFSDVTQLNAINEFIEVEKGSLHSMNLKNNL